MVDNSIDSISSFIDNIINELYRTGKMNNVSIDNISVNNENVYPKNVSKKLTTHKSRKSKKQKKEIITQENINTYIEKYLTDNPEILTSFLKNHVKVDFKAKRTDIGNTRYALALYVDGKCVSESTLCLNI